MTFEISQKALMESNARVFSGTVVGTAISTQHSCYRAHCNNVAPIVLHHVWEECFHCPVVGYDINVVSGLDDPVGQVPEWLTAHYAGIIDQNINMTDVADGLCRLMVDFFAIRNVNHIALAVVVALLCQKIDSDFNS